MSFPTTPAVFPPRVTNTVVRAAHVNEYADEIEVVEGGWLSPNGQTLAPWRLRSGAVGLEFGDANAAGGGSTLSHQSGVGSGLVGFHCEPGATPNSLKTRGIPGVTLGASQAGSGFFVQSAQAAVADPATVTSLLTFAPEGPVSFSGVPVCRLQHTVAQSIAHNTLTPLLFNTEDADPYGMHAPGGSSITLGAGMAGWYLVTGVFELAANTAGSRILVLYRNGAVALTVQGRCGAAAADFNLVWLLPCADLDVLELRVRQTSGVALNAISNRFAVVKVA